MRDSDALSFELFELQDAERRAKQRLRLARHTLQDCRKAVAEIAKAKARAEARILQSLGR